MKYNRVGTILKKCFNEMVLVIFSQRFLDMWLYNDSRHTSDLLWTSSNSTYTRRVSGVF